MEPIILSRPRLDDVEQMIKSDRTRFQSLLGINTPLDNHKNNDYLGALTIGGSEAKRLVFDTGSTWLTVTSDKCTNCYSMAYQTSQGST